MNAGGNGSNMVQLAVPNGFEASEIRVVYRKTKPRPKITYKYQSLDAFKKDSLTCKCPKCPPKLPRTKSDPIPFSAIDCYREFVGF